MKNHCRKTSADNNIFSCVFHQILITQFYFNLSAITILNVIGLRNKIIAANSLSCGLFSSSISIQDSSLTSMYYLQGVRCGFGFSLLIWIYTVFKQLSMVLQFLSTFGFYQVDSGIIIWIEHLDNSD